MSHTRKLEVWGMQQASENDSQILFSNFVFVRFAGLPINVLWRCSESRVLDSVIVLIPDDYNKRHVLAVLMNASNLLGKRRTDQGSILPKVHVNLG